MNRELVHRVGNLLAVAQGIIRLSYDASLSTLEFMDSILARLHALNQSVKLINREDWKGVWLHELLQTELAPVSDRILAFAWLLSGWLFSFFPWSSYSA